MPPPERHMVYQKAVVWDVADGFDDNGEHTVYEPIEVIVRWENVNTEVQDAEKNNIRVDIVVFTIADLNVGGMMYLSALADLPTTYQVKRIVKFDSTQDIKGRNYQKCAYLSAQSYTLPAIVGSGS